MRRDTPVGVGALEPRDPARLRDLTQDALLPRAERCPGADPPEHARRDQVGEGSVHRRARQRRLVAHLPQRRGIEPIDDRKHLIGPGGPRRCERGPVIEVCGEMLRTKGAPRIDPGGPHDVLQLVHIAEPRVRARHHLGLPAESFARKWVPTKAIC